MNQDEKARIERNAARCARIEKLLMDDAVALLETGESLITDTARGQLLKFVQQNGFNADLTTIPIERRLATGLTPEDLASSEEDKW